MSNLKYRQQKIQEKREQTPWREFLRDICSWYAMTFYKTGGTIAKFPYQNRVYVTNYSDYYKDIDLHELYESPSGKDFFSMLYAVIQQIGLPTLFVVGENENAAFSDLVHHSKNVYLSNSVVFDCENIGYCFNIKERSTDCFNAISIFDNSSNIYQSVGVFQSHNIYFSKHILNSSNCRFCCNMDGCHECIDSNGLKNSSYAVSNKVYPKEEYFLLKAKILIQKKDFDARYHVMLNKYLDDRIQVNSKGIENGIVTYQLHDSRNVLCCGSKEGNKSYLDVFNTGSQGASYIYASLNSGGGSEQVYCSFLVGFSQNIFYSFDIMNCSFCLGCIGLKNKSYCIFNKQYAKEERYEKVDEIFSQMEKDGILGQFFPGSMNPFYFNDTAAYLIDPTFTKEEVTALGYLRRDEPIQVDVPEGAIVVKTSELDQYEGLDQQGNWVIDPNILKVIIQDDEGNVYRIVKMEYDFLMKHGLPLPRKHRLERMKENFKILPSE